ncbi:MAG: ribosome maturation factor RimP [Solirubrobacteraceae bacterium]
MAVLSWPDSFRAGAVATAVLHRKWALARFFFVMNQFQSDIETRIAGCEPDIEVLLVERSGTTLRIFIDCPTGVTVAHCERVTRALADLRESYAIEVSSPGPQRPLAKPEHFQRFVGRRARVRIARDCEGFAQRSLTGELVGASSESVTLAAADGIVAIPYEAIERSHLVRE